MRRDVVFPALAGMIRNRWPCDAARRRVPRARGDDPPAGTNTRWGNRGINRDFTQTKRMSQTP